MAPIDFPLLIGAVLLLVSILSAKLFGSSRIPTMLLFILVGVLAGSEGLGGIYFDDTRLAQSIGIVSLIFILFSGGLDTNWSESRLILKPALWLSSLGVLLTALAVAAMVTIIFHAPFLWSLLVGSIISSTDASAVFSILRAGNLELKGKLKPLLELESASNDPMAVFLTIATLELLMSPQRSALHTGIVFLVQFVAGVLIGWLGGKGMIWLINRVTFGYEGYYPVFSLAMIIFIYALSATLGGSGVLAVYIAGVLVGNSSLTHKRTLIRFFDGLSILGHIALFLTLGLLVFPSDLVVVMGTGLLLSAVLMCLARPLAVFLILLPFRFRFREIVFTSWVGLRGAVPIVLAVFPLSAGIENSRLIFNLVFFIVLTSAVLQGWSINVAAKLLHLAKPLSKKRVRPLEFTAKQGSDTELIDVIIPYDSPVDGKKIVDLNFPDNCIVVLIIREEEHIIPKGGTTLLGGDVLSLLVNKADIGSIQGMF